MQMNRKGNSHFQREKFVIIRRKPVWGTKVVGHDNGCLGETRYHQKRKGGCGVLTVLVLHKPSSLYHRGVRLGWYQKRLVLDDGSKVREDSVDLQ